MIKEKYESLKELSFKKIEQKYLPVLEKFKTTQKDLKDFLIEDALRSQEMFISTTYLIFDAEEEKRSGENPKYLSLLGYVTILNDSISLNTKMKQLFREKGINYRSLPALKVGRLCVDQAFERRGIGKLIVAFCIEKACMLNKEISCRFITLDAKRDSDKNKDSLHFYTKMGFVILDHKEKSEIDLRKQTNGTTPMYLDLFHIIKNKVTTQE
jgi:GNAT superfamily N-acetyltransferase